MTLDAKTLGEELVGAEIVAGKELTQAAGSLFDTLERTRDIWVQQGRWLAEDYVRFWLSAPGRPGDLAPLNRLIEDRSTHIASGMHELGTLVERECIPLSKIWSDFLGTVGRDWRSA
jgi:hypothetical protein